MVERFRKKPVIVDALQWTGENKNELYSFAGEHVKFIGRDEKLIIVTLEGSIIADTNDYIIKGIKGEFYPCKPDIFVATYEKL